MHRIKRELDLYIASPKSLLALAVFLVENLSFFAELQIRGSIKDNSKIIFLISQPKHM